MTYSEAKRVLESVLNSGEIKSPIKMLQALLKAIEALDTIAMLEGEVGVNEDT